MNRVGRFESANGGTLFLDEIGELSLASQVKLLRALQSRHIDRVGENRSRPIDVRVVAATNADLERMIQEGRFRDDLYYRLNVFPIDLPALRDRRDDIPLLATHFMQRAARKLGKRLEKIDADSMQRLVAHGWPGNIRDLQNVIERAAILADNSELVVNWELGPAVPGSAPPLPAAAGNSGNGADEPASLALTTLERKHIVDVLKRTRGIIEGPQGAAAMLHLKPSTARFRIRKLGIDRKEYLPG
jgi:formate hydrogenlyase transcriptional activator